MSFTSGDRPQGEAATDLDDAPEESFQWLESGVLRVPYIPDFRVDELIYYFSPSRREPREVYHTLPEATLDRWGSYLTKKGYRFLADPAGRPDHEGPFRVRPGETRIEILEPGKLFAPKPQFATGKDEPFAPLVSLEKRRPYDPWKPTYIKALNFIKKYKSPRPTPRAVEYALWEAEEASEIAGSVSWENAERILLEHARSSDDVRTVLADVFEKRPEDFPLASRIYLRVLGRSGEEGFDAVCSFHTSTLKLKRIVVASVLGELGNPRGLDVLLKLAEDEEPEVRLAALEAIARVGIPADHARAESLRELREGDDPQLAVWATAALLRGGDKSQQKRLFQFVKESDLPLVDLGDLGQILVDLELKQAVPFLIKRLKSDRAEIADDAAESLRALTGIAPEFYAHAPAETRRAAIRAWDRWWQDYKRNKSSR